MIGRVRTSDELAEQECICTSIPACIGFFNPNYTLRDFYEYVNELWG